MSAVRPRGLSWEGCLNVRDLGGQPTEDGSETAFGYVVRSDNTERLTAAGWQAALEYGVRTVVDLRLADERVTPLPEGLGVTALHFPLLPDFGHPDWEEINGLVEAIDPPESTRLVYREFLHRYRESFGKAISAIACAESAVLVHCQAGKDRTGLIAALMLRLAGVGIDTIAGDYALSETNLRPFTDAWLAEATTDDERRRRTRLIRTPAEAMAAVLADLEDEHGGIEAYLLGAGSSPDDLARVRERLRG